MTTILEVLDAVADDAPEPPSLEQLRSRSEHRRRRRLRSVSAVASIAVLGAGGVGLALGASQPDEPGLTASASTLDAAQDVSEDGSAQTETGLPSPTTSITQTNNSDPAPIVDEVSPQAAIPPPLDENDARSPIERFLNVPADPVEAGAWAQAATGQAVTECMAERGHAYTENLGESQPVPAELIEEVDACHEWAATQTNLLPAAEDEFHVLQDRISSDPRSVVATDALDECLVANEATESLTIPEACSDAKANTDLVYLTLVEEYSPAWVVEHLVVLEEIRDRIAGFVERSEF